MATQAELDEVNAAISAVQTGAQRYRLKDGTEVQRANLADLEARRRTLEGELAARTSGGYFTRLGFGSAR